MKRLIFTILFLLTTIYSGVLADETLKYYKNKGQFYYPSPNIDLQCARFEPKAPCYIKSLKVLLGGSSTGTARVRIFGYEAGDSYPELQNDKIPPIHIQKTYPSNQNISVTLPDSIYFDNSWFWVCIDSLSSGVYLMTDSARVDSIPYNQYLYELLHINNVPADSAWAGGPSAFFISVVVSYPQNVSPRYLRDYTDSAGITKEALTTCIAAADYDGDGYEDLMINSKLYHNNGNGTFTDVTQQLGIIDDNNHSHPGISQCYTFVDMNNDGLMDVVIFGYDTSMVFIHNANGTFTPKILSLPPFHTFTYSPLLFNWADLNNDGYPDLVALQQASVYGPNGPDTLTSYVFINDKNNNFRNESTRMFPPGHLWRRARASEFADFNNDGFPDLYIANYFLQRDELYLNDGTGNFTDIADEKNIDINSLGGSMHGSGIGFCDYDNDGNLDFFVARIAHARFVPNLGGGQGDHQGGALYHNDGPPDYNFTNLTGQYNNYPGQIAPCGLEYEDYQSSAAWADVNNDGLPDLLIKTYNPYRFISFYEQQPDHSFKMKRFEYGLDRLDCYGSGQVWFDFNNDGKLDLALYNQDKIQLYKNYIANGKHPVEFDLRCVSGNRFAIGARVYVYSGNKMFMRELACGQDECVQFPYRLHFGLGDVTNLDSVVVLWPTVPRKKDVYLNLKWGNIYKLTEGGAVSESPLSVKPLIAYKIRMVAYPNPFTDNVTISYTLTKPSNVVLKIFDGEGKYITTLVNQMQDEGDQFTSFNAKGLPSGSYYYQLQIDGELQTNKLILVK